MQQIKTLRASGLPQLMACGPSETNPDRLQEVFIEIDASETGTLVHEFAQRIVVSGEYDVEELRKRRPNDLARAETLITNFFEVWKEAQFTITTPVTELHHVATLLDATEGKLMLSGHIDLCQFGPKNAIILDYKTGRLHDDHYHQVAGYAYLLWDKAGRPVAYKVDVAVVYLEDLAVTNYQFTGRELAKWRDEVVAKVSDTRYTVGKKCAFCKIQGSCPAYREYTQAAIKFFQSDDAQKGRVGWIDVDPEERGSLVDVMYVVGKGIERVKDSLKSALGGRKGNQALDLGKGMEYSKTVRTYEGLNTQAALPILRERFDQQHIDGVVQIELADALNLAAKFAKAGKKVEAKEKLKEKLKAGGAIYSGTTDRFERRPKKELK